MASKVNPKNYYVVQGWMVSELGLKGNELAIYAIVYGFSQNQQSFNGSLKYLADWTNLSKQTIITCLKSLVEKGFLNKTERIVDSVKLCQYAAIVPDGGSQNSLPPQSKNLNGGSQIILPNNINDNTDDNTEDNIICVLGSTPVKLDSGRLMYPTEFESFWNIYPRSVEKGKAYKAFCARIKDGWTPDQLICATRKYAAECRRNRTETKYIKHPASFLSATTPFTDFLPMGGDAGHGYADDISSAWDAGTV